MAERAFGEQRAHPAGQVIAALGPVLAATNYRPSAGAVIECLRIDAEVVRQRPRPAVGDHGDQRVDPAGLEKSVGHSDAELTREVVIAGPRGAYPALLFG